MADTPPSLKVTDLRYRGADLLGAIVCLGMAAYVVFGFAVSRGIAVGDDAFFASLAKCLASGHGYSTPLDSNGDIEGVSPFNIGASTGPSVILPVALAMRLFGYSDAVAPLASSALWLTLTVLIVVPFYRLESKPLVSPMLILLVLGIFGLFGWHFEQWYTMLGEVPSAFFMMLAMTLLSLRDATALGSFYAGTCAGLAITSKLLVILALPGVVLAWWLAWRTSHRAQTRLTSLTLLAFGIMLPTLTFEIAKLAVLGPGPYVENWREFLKFMAAQGITATASSGWTKLEEGLAALDFRFALSSFRTTVLLGLIGLAIARAAKSRVKNLAVCSLAAAATLFAYWILFSNGWPRYAVIPLTLSLLALAVVPLALQKMESMVFTLAAGLVLAMGIPRMGEAFRPADRGLYEASSARQERAELVRLVQARLANSDTLLVSQWWATFVDIQYGLHDLTNIYRLDSFHQSAAYRRTPRPRVIFIACLQFLDLNDPRIAELMARKTPRMYDGKYYVALEL